MLTVIIGPIIQGLSNKDLIFTQHQHKCAEELHIHQLTLQSRDRIQTPSCYGHPLVLGLLNLKVKDWQAVERGKYQKIKTSGRSQAVPLQWLAHLIIQFVIFCMKKTFVFCMIYLSKIVNFDIPKQNKRRRIAKQLKRKNVQLKQQKGKNKRNEKNERKVTKK
jgi:hypothetical protein